jgi:hypothetical protein
VFYCDRGGPIDCHKNVINLVDPANPAWQAALGGAGATWPRHIDRTPAPARLRAT